MLTTTSVFPEDAITQGNLVLLKEVIERKINIVDKITELKSKPVLEPPDLGVTTALQYLKIKGISVQSDSYIGNGTNLSHEIAYQTRLTKLTSLFLWLIRFSACRDDPQFHKNISVLKNHDELSPVSFPHINERSKQLEIREMLYMVRSPKRQVLKSADIEQEAMDVYEGTNDLCMPQWPTTQEQKNTEENTT